MNIVKELRKRAGLGQKEVAAMIGVAQPTVSEWENQKKDPSGERLEKLSEIFGVSKNEILQIVPLGKHETHTVTDEDIKFALFGEEGVTDEDFEDVKRYAAFIRSRKNNGTL